MWFTQYIVEQLAAARDWFADAYNEVRGWIFPFNYLAYPLYGLFVVFYYLVYYFTSFDEWIDWAVARIGQILSEWDIWSTFETWFRYAEWAWNWVYNAFANVWNTVGSWWQETGMTVISWINSAVATVQDMVNQVSSWLASLQVEWSTFKSRIPSIDSVLGWFSNWWNNVTSAISTWWTGAIKDVQRLIDSAFTARAGFWAGWQDWRDSVTDFFSDPLGWLYDRLDEFFERFW